MTTPASRALASVSTCGLLLRQLRLIVSPYWETRSDSGYESKNGQAEEALIEFLGCDRAYLCAGRHPAAAACSSLQNQRSPAPFIVTRS